MTPHLFLLVPSRLQLPILKKKGIYISPTITPKGMILPWAVLKHIKVTPVYQMIHE